MVKILPEFSTEFQFEEAIQYFKDKITERSKVHKYVSITLGDKVLADKLIERFDISSEGSTKELHFYGYDVNPVRGEDGAIRGFNESVPNEPVIRVRLRKLPGKSGTIVQVSVLDEDYEDEALFLTEHLAGKIAQDEAKLKDIVLEAMRLYPDKQGRMSQAAWNYIFGHFEGIDGAKPDNFAIVESTGKDIATVRKAKSRYEQDKQDRSHET